MALNRVLGAVQRLGNATKKRSRGLSQIFGSLRKSINAYCLNVKKAFCYYLLIILVGTSFGQLIPSRKISTVANISDEIIKRANQGMPYYQFTLGKCYLYGRGTEKNYDEAVKWLKKAADQNNPGALNSLGICSFHGYGVKQDYDVAVSYFQKSADYGDAYGQFNLAVCYMQGKGVKNNVKKSEELFKMAEEKGLFRKDIEKENKKDVKP